MEDEDALCEVTKRILSRNGYQVLTAATGPEAIKIAEDFPHRIVLLLTDVIMPQRHGQEFTEQISATRPGIRVVFVSGYAQPVIAGAGILSLLTRSGPWSRVSGIRSGRPCAGR